jgi:hypothetical protein
VAHGAHGSRLLMAAGGPEGSRIPSSPVRRRARSGWHAVLPVRVHSYELGLQKGPEGEENRHTSCSSLLVPCFLLHRSRSHSSSSGLPIIA